MRLKEMDFSVLQQCMHCGMCLPTFATDDLEMAEGFADEMSFCLGCLACESACPAGVDYAGLFEASRADIEEKGLNKGLGRKLVRFGTLECLFMRPRLLRWAGRGMRLWQKLGAAKFLPARLRALERQAPEIGERFSNELIEPIEGEGKWKVAMLTGCVQDLAYAEINRDTVDVLVANGCEVHTPPVQPCCGSIHAHNGEEEMARANARRLLDLLPPDSFDVIISNAGGCGSHMRHFAKLLPNDGRAKEWDAKVRDIHEFLVEVKVRPPMAAPFEEKVRVTYHDSCHLAHGQKVVLPPRMVIDLMPGVTRVELKESDWCCGSAGVYSLTQPEQSRLLLERKAGHIRATGAKILLTANPGCHLQIQNAMPELNVLHPVTLLAKAYRNEC
jgi:glycolate oxidase iron-sulfur subunit